MTTQTAIFGRFLKGNFDQSFDQLLEKLRSESDYYGREDDRTLKPAVQTTLYSIADGLITQQDEPVIKRAQEIGNMRAQSGFLLDDILSAFTILRKFVLETLDRFILEGQTWSVADQRALEEVLQTLNRSLVHGFSVTYEEIRNELTSQRAELDSQRMTIRELGTPILPLYEGVIAMPLVGSIDSYRATEIMERLLEAISEKQADIVIIDITGVSIIDTGVANYLLQTARAARLVGAEIVLVGIGAEIAQTITQLGVDLSQIVVQANLQDGINYALERLGLHIVKVVTSE